MARLRLLLLVCALATLAGCQCISPSSLRGFACEGDGGCGLEGFTCCEDSVCRLDCTGDDDGGRDGGPDGGGACGPTTCDGCCEGEVCRTGLASAACGVGGEACGACDPVNQRCVAGACQTLLANGTVCAAGPECVSSFCVEGHCCESACDGVCGTCSAPGLEGRCAARAEGTAAGSCAPFVCDGINPGCPVSCTTIRQCVAGRYCETGAGQCLSVKANGQPCGAGTECTTGYCADGVCCDTPCSGSCDRCNQASLMGQCRPAASDDPGSPSCGTYVCNGTLPDCPIPCTVAGGCPQGTYCSGTYCSAKKVLGIPCADAGECLSDQCVDAVCCDGPCAGECDACSVAAGAPGNGTCTLLGAAKVCRAAAGTCDLEERCNGTLASCPQDAFTPANTTCATTQYGTWSVCAPPPALACSVTGTQTRSRTDSACDGLGACSADAGTESAACSRATEDTSCGTISYGAWSACSYADATCSAAGSRTRSKTEPLCQGGACQPVATTETDTVGCARTTEGTACGAVSNGPWSACSYADACSTGGSRTRTNTGMVCQSGTCQQSTSTETDTAGCARTTGGQGCGAGTTYGAWSACSYANSCSTGGTRTRPVTTYTCGSGTCNGNTTTETDNSACGRSTTGQSCGAGTTYGAWGACGYANGCSNSGSRTRTVTTYTCGSGTCNGNNTTDTDTAGCGRSMDGQSCGSTSYGGWTGCSYSGTCSNGGSRTRQVTVYTCGGGSCGSNTNTETDTSGCGRNTDGTSCGASTYGPWGSCTAPSMSCSGTQSRTRTDYACAGGACGSSGANESQGCTLPDGANCSTTCSCAGPPDCLRLRWGCFAGACEEFGGSPCGICGGGCIPQ